AGALSAADPASSRSGDRQRMITDLETSIARAGLRRRAADRGVFLLGDGGDAGVEQRSLEDARLKLAEIEADLAGAKTAVEASRRVVDAARDAYQSARRTTIQAPPGSMIWSLLTAPGATVQPGSPVADWLDCSVMLVDVPVADVEIGLLRPGM